MSDQFLADLREEVERLETPPKRARGLAPLLAAAAVVAVVATGVLVMNDTTDVSADVEIVRDGDELIVRLTDITTRPDEIEEAAEEAGLDVVVEEVPVGPSAIGQFVGATGSDGFPPQLRSESGGELNEMRFAGFRIPADFDSRLTLLLGREGQPGEMWHVPSNAVAPGEPLACQELIGRKFERTAEAIEEQGLDERYTVRVLSMDSPDDLQPDQYDEMADWTVLEIGRLASDEIQVVITENPIREVSTDLPAGC